MFLTLSSLNMSFVMLILLTIVYCKDELELGNGVQNDCTLLVLSSDAFHKLELGN